jgi:hypothetical protein
MTFLPNDYKNLRKYTNLTLELVDEGVFDAKDLLENALGWMSEDDVKKFLEVNALMEIVEAGYYDPDENEDEDEDDEDLS